MTHMNNIKQLFDETINECHYIIYNATASNNVVYTLSEMQKLKDIKDFVLAMIKEVEGYDSRDH